MINLALTEGVFLGKWNNAVVKPLIKKSGLDTAFANYRPVSNLLFLSKILEKLSAISYKITYKVGIFFQTTRVATELSTRQKPPFSS